MRNSKKSRMTRGVVEILKNINEHVLRPADISARERRMCVQYLRCEGYTQEEIAEIFQVHRMTIIRDEKANRREMAKLADEIDVKGFVGNLIAWANHLVTKASREKDYMLVWKIKRELLADLQSLGYLPRAPQQHQIQMTNFVDLVQLATKQVASEVIEPDTDQQNKLPPVNGSAAEDGQHLPSDDDDKMLNIRA